MFLGDPSAWQTALALRQAIWRKSEPAWPVSGLPAALYVEKGWLAGGWLPRMPDTLEALDLLLLHRISEGVTMISASARRFIQ